MCTYGSAASAAARAYPADRKHDRWQCVSRRDGIPAEREESSDKQIHRPRICRTSLDQATVAPRASSLVGRRQRRSAAEKFLCGGDGDIADALEYLAAMLGVRAGWIAEDAVLADCPDTVLLDEWHQL